MCMCVFCFVLFRSIGPLCLYPRAWFTDYLIYSHVHECHIYDLKLKGNNIQPGFVFSVFLTSPHTANLGHWQAAASSYYSHEKSLVNALIRLREQWDDFAGQSKYSFFCWRTQLFGINVTRTGSAKQTYLHVVCSGNSVETYSLRKGLRVSNVTILFSLKSTLAPHSMRTGAKGNEWKHMSSAAMQI